MRDIPGLLADELALRPAQVKEALALFSEGATVPFVARYRKERTGGMDEVQLRTLGERHAYLSELEARKTVVLASIDSERLSAALKAQIDACTLKTALEDLYLPYRPKRRTRATVAREKGLEPLAEKVRALNRSGTAVGLEQLAGGYLGPSVETTREALAGAADILAEGVAEQATYRAYLRDYIARTGSFKSRIKDAHPEGTTRFEMYRDYQVRVQAIAPHNLLALLRGEAEGVLTVDVSFDEAAVLQYLEAREIRTRDHPLRNFYQEMVKDAFNRLMKDSLTGEVRQAKKHDADLASIQTFEANLRELLLASPAGRSPTLAIDPGFRTGCKVAVISATGKFLENATIFPHQSAAERAQAGRTLRALITKHGVRFIAIGNGTAGRETEAFVGEALEAIEPKPVKVMVNESGASIYSASEIAIEEFPDLDVTVRGAVSIARRLQDPLAELVKIDPKSIGVGQYQHDVDQKLLRRKLDETVESCVNYVGVDLNTASRHVLAFVSGITPTVARNIIAFRDAHGAFADRRELLKVAKLGARTFEQAAGFLRIAGGLNPLDNTAVHPESYPTVARMAADLGVPLAQISQSPERLKTLDLARYATATLGEPTLRDLLVELEKPGRDPRSAFAYATFKTGVNTMKDLVVGMELEGVVTNVTNFGAFVDVGVHQDGLVHVSQLADRFVDDPKKVVKVGQVVRVQVIDVNVSLKRIALSMRSGETGTGPRR